MPAAAEEALASPGLIERIIELGAGCPRYGDAGPDRAELPALIAADRPRGPATRDELLDLRCERVDRSDEPH